MAVIGNDEHGIYGQKHHVLVEEFAGHEHSKGIKNPLRAKVFCNSLPLSARKGIY